MNSESLPNLRDKLLREQCGMRASFLHFVQFLQEKHDCTRESQRVVELEASHDNEVSPSENEHKKRTGTRRDKNTPYASNVGLAQTSSSTLRKFTRKDKTARWIGIEETKSGP